MSVDVTPDRRAACNCCSAGDLSVPAGYPVIGVHGDERISWRIVVSYGVESQNLVRDTSTEGIEPGVDGCRIAVRIQGSVGIIAQGGELFPVRSDKKWHRGAVLL